MNDTPDTVAQRLAQLKADLTEQGRRVQSLIEAAFEAVFDRDPDRAGWVVRQDDLIDRVDVDIEKAAVQLLIDSSRSPGKLDAERIRGVLTIVKINNELERVADSAVSIAEMVQRTLKDQPAAVPETFRVMANSVIGIIRDTNLSFANSDPRLANVVLQSEDTVEAFKAAILRDAEQKTADRSMPTDLAFALHEIANQCERMADHCTNIAEQIIYAATGAIVRHTEGGWVEVGLD